jgi:hypothetical protein
MRVGPPILSVALVAALGAASCSSGGVRGALGTDTGSPPPPTASTHEVPPGFRTYRSDAYSFSIRYPSDWSPEEGLEGAVVVLFAPSDGPSDAFRENVNVLVQELPAGTTLQEYDDASLEQAPDVIPDFHVVRRTRLTLDGTPAEEIRYTGSQQGSSLEWIAVWLVADDRAYVVTYTAPHADFERLLTTATTVLESLRLD